MRPRSLAGSFGLGALVVGQIGLVWGMNAWTGHRIRGIEDDLFARESPQRKARAELLLDQAFLANRSIAAMAPIRAISGGNRKPGDPDPILRRRIAPEGAYAVQQLYNHVASTIPVSEIYCVLDGFSPDAGETPLLTWDHLITGDQDATSGESAEESSKDAPEEVEADEYRAFTGQLETFRTDRARKGIVEAGIEALSSGVLRTCDNSQYLSIRDGDVHNADGFVYSAPITTADGRFRGMISTVLRVASVEAYLLDIPFVPLTTADSIARVKIGFEMPDTLRAVLSHPSTGLHIGDRRDAAMLEAVRSANGNEVEGMRRIRLAATDESPWFLYWRPDPGPIRTARRVGIVLTVLASLLLWTLGWSGASWWRNNRRQAIHTEVARSSARVLENARSLRTSGLSLQEAQQAAVELARTVRSEAGSIQHHLGGLSASSTEMAASAEEVACEAVEAARLGGQADEAAHAISQHVDRLLLSGDEVARSIDLIAEVADQIKLLSLNATLEAARAGASGKGFSVVAAEIRSLADHTTLATRSIEMVVERIQADIRATSDAAGRVAQSLSNVARSQERIAASAGNQRTTAAEVARAAEESVQLTQGIEAKMRASETSSNEALSLASEAIVRAGSIMSSAESLANVASQAAGKVDPPA